VGQQVVWQKSRRGIKPPSLKGSNGIGEDEINELVKHFPDKLAIETKHAGPTGGRPSKLVRLIEK